MGFPQTNLLLEALPPQTRKMLLHHLVPVALPLRTVLFEEDSLPRHAHFITSGMASIVTILSEGDAVEVGLAARESIAERVHLLGPLQGMTRCFMQIAGTALRMDFGRLEEIFSRDPIVRRAVLRLVQHEVLGLTQLGACNRLHGVEERLARWLLMVSDRTGHPELGLTQEFLGEMLGARRPTVNLTARSLQKAGLIEYRRAFIRIVDREGLEDVACECYPVVKKLLSELYKNLPTNI